MNSISQDKEGNYAINAQPAIRISYRSSNQCHLSLWYCTSSHRQQSSSVLKWGARRKVLPLMATVLITSIFSLGPISHAIIAWLSRPTLTIHAWNGDLTSTSIWLPMVYRSLFKLCHSSSISTRSGHCLEPRPCA